VLPFSRPAYEAVLMEATPKRLSISGVQTKLPLALRDHNLELVQFGGEYILKPVPHGAFRNLESVPYNEHLTMQLARQVFGIRVAANAIVEFLDGEPAYLVRRFDIAVDGSRLLQEDFGQLSERTEEMQGEIWKYDGSYEGIGRLIQKHAANYKVDLERFVRLVLFNYLVHNGDAHLKNFTLTRNGMKGSYSFSPTYDLLNTTIHVPNESRMALDLFADDFETESFRLNGFHTMGDFELLAQRPGLQSARFRKFSDSISGCKDAVHSLIDRSRLIEPCKELYRTHLEDSLRALQ